MNKEETWERLVKLGVVSGEIRLNRWEGLDLTGVDLKKIDLTKADLSKADLTGAKLTEADLSRATLTGADLSRAILTRANLSGANLTSADLTNADLVKTNLMRANLFEAKLIKANLSSVTNPTRDSPPHKAKFHGGRPPHEALFFMANLTKADLTGANLIGVDFAAADLSDAILDDTDLTNASFSGAVLVMTNFIRSNLVRVNFDSANLTKAKFNGSTLDRVDLQYAHLIETDFSGATISNCDIYGISAWGIKFDASTTQTDLRITPDNEPAITVDNIEVGQFVYLLLHNEKIRYAIDTIGKKGVLILGRFTPERKEVLDAIRNKLRELGYVPMMFDFDRPTQRDFTETIKILAGLSRFIIADITNPSSSPLELQATVPDYMVPFVPIIHKNEKPFAMFVYFQKKYSWMLELKIYNSTQNLTNMLQSEIINPAEEKAGELIKQKQVGVAAKHINKSDP